MILLLPLNALVGIYLVEFDTITVRDGTSPTDQISRLDFRYPILSGTSYKYEAGHEKRYKSKFLVTEIIAKL